MILKVLETGAHLLSTQRGIFFLLSGKKKSTIYWCFHIKGEGFLKQMIRNIVGTQLRLLQTKQGVTKWEQIIRAKNRQSAYICAPAEGLYLCKVYYPLSLTKACQKI